MNTEVTEPPAEANLAQMTEEECFQMVLTLQTQCRLQGVSLLGHPLFPSAASLTALGADVDNGPVQRKILALKAKLEEINQ